MCGFSIGSNVNSYESRCHAGLTRIGLSVLHKTCCAGRAASCAGLIPMTEQIVGATKNLLPKTYEVRMATFDQFPALACKNCFRPIPLPPATRPDTLEGQGLWPEGGSRRNFLCAACRHVHGYSAPDVQLMLPHTDPRRAGTSYNVVYIRIQCGVQSCVSILRIRTLMAFDKCPYEGSAAMLISSQAHAIACGNGHILSGPIVLYGLAYDAKFDEDWEIGEGWNRRTPARLCA